MPSMSSQCFGCKHFKFSKNTRSFKCKAFPNKIPDEILFGDFKHDTIHPLQRNNVIFEPLYENLIDQK